MTTTAGTPNPEKLEQFQTLTRRYARFCSEISGIPLIVCALLSIGVFLFGQRFPTPKGNFLLLATGIFLVWIGYAQMFRNAHYRKLGFVQFDPKQEKKLTRADWIKILVFAFFGALITFLIPVAFGKFTNNLRFDLPSEVSVFVILVLAFAFPRLIKEPGLELPIIAFGLAVQLQFFPIAFLTDDARIFVVAALSIGMAFLGLKQHLRFLEVTRQLTQLHSTIGNQS